jgi:membrane associated rhomboid family serine protease
MTTTGRRPWLTVGVLATTTAVSTLGLVDHAVLHELERRGGELADGEPWRLVTSLLVHDSWLALLANLVLLALVGIAVERRHARAEWIVLYLAAGIVGELVGLDWQPHGAGNSVAILGLAGALVVDALQRRDPAFVPLGYTTVVLVTLGAADVGGIGGTVIIVLAYLAAGASFAAIQRATRVPSSAGPILGAVTVGVALALVALGNIHGPALLTGVAVAAAWDARRIRDPGGARTGPSPHRG